MPQSGFLARLTGVMGLSCLAIPSAHAYQFTIHSAILGEYVSEIGPTPAQSKGMLIEIATAAFTDAGLSVAMSPEVPWARAQGDAADDPGGLIVSLARTPPREPIWNWLTTTYVDQLYGYTVQGHPIYKSYDELKLKRPAIGVKLASASATILESRDVDFSAVVDFLTSYKMLLLGRIDIVLIQGMEAYAPLQALSLDRSPENYHEKLHELTRTSFQEMPLWLVASKKIPFDEQIKLKAAMETFKTTERYKDIVRSYESKIERLIN